MTDTERITKCEERLARLEALVGTLLSCVGADATTTTASAPADTTPTKERSLTEGTAATQKKAEPLAKAEGKMIDLVTIISEIIARYRREKDKERAAIVNQVIAATEAKREQAITTDIDLKVNRKLRQSEPEKEKETGRGGIA